VTRIAPQAHVAYILGTCDAKIAQICEEIPKGSQNNKVLSLCLVDPFDFGLKFETLKKLSVFYVDFIVLLAIGMDANRNYDHYVDGDSPKIDEALGNTLVPGCETATWSQSRMGALRRFNVAHD
jgi:hypothetical protein